MEAQYRALLSEAMSSGVHRDDRTGVGCKSLFAQTIEFDTEGGLYWPLVSGKRMYEKIWKTESEWFLSGRTDDKLFKENGVHIWDEWMKDGTIGKGYGYQLRQWQGKVDQLTRLIENIKTDPDSRRHLVSLWNPAELTETTLPPCHMMFQLFVEGDKLNILINMRSTDLFLGLPYDLQLYFTVLKHITDQTGHKMGKITFMMADAHVYDNHHKQIEEYLRQPITTKLEVGNLNKQAKSITAPVAI